MSNYLTPMIFAEIVDHTPRVFQSDATAAAERLAVECVADFDSVFAGLPGARKAVDFALKHLGLLSVWSADQPGCPIPLMVVGFEIANKTTLIRSFAGTATTARIFSVLDRVAAEYLPDDLFPQFCDQKITARTASEMTFAIRTREQELIYLGAPSAAKLARRRLGIGF